MIIENFEYVVCDTYICECLYIFNEDKSLCIIHDDDDYDVVWL